MTSSPIRCESLAKECGADWDGGLFSVVQFPQLEFSKRDVIRAGDALRGKIFWEREAEILEIFKAAYYLH